jgi:hypothetical protein
MELTTSQQHRLYAEDRPGPTDECDQTAADRALRVLVRDALAPASVPSISHDVMASLGSVRSSVGTVLRDEAGPSPRLWPVVAEAIGAPMDDTGALFRSALQAAAVAVAEPGPVAVPAERRHWRLPAALVALAAATLLAVLTWTQPEPTQPVVNIVPVEFDIPGRTEIESLESETAAVVQVLQFDDDSPTIIFIDDTPMDEELE